MLPSNISVKTNLKKTKKLLWHVNNTTQTPPFSHEIESFVDIFKWNIVSNEFVNLNFLQAKIVKNYYIVRQQIYQSEFPTGINLEYKLRGYSTI